MLTCSLGTERKMDEKKKIKSHDPESQSHDTITYSTYVCHSSGENCDNKFSRKRQKNGQIKERIRARGPIFNPTIQQLIIHVYTKFPDSSYNSS